MKHAPRLKRLTSFLLAFCVSASSFSVLPAFANTLAEDHTILYYLIELQRRRTLNCGGTAFPEAPSLTPSESLRRLAAESIRSGTAPEVFANSNGLDGVAFFSARFPGQSAQESFDQLKAAQCPALMKAEYRYIGAYKDSGQWTLFMAATEPAKKEVPAPATNGTEAATFAPATNGTVPATSVVATNATVPATTEGALPTIPATPQAQPVTPASQPGVTPLTEAPGIAPAVVTTPAEADVPAPGLTPVSDLGQPASATNSTAPAVPAAKGEIIAPATAGAAVAASATAGGGVVVAKDAPSVFDRKNDNPEAASPIPVTEFKVNPVGKITDSKALAPQTTPSLGTPPAVAPVPAPSGPQDVTTPDKSDVSQGVSERKKTEAVQPKPAPAGLKNPVGDIFSLVNGARAEGRLCGDTMMPAAARVQQNMQLENIAQVHALDMGQRNYLSSTSPDGVRLGARVTKGGYTWSAVAENVANAALTPREVVAIWLANDKQCKNIMDPGYTETGIGYDEQTKHWVLLLAAPMTDEGLRMELP